MKAFRMNLISAGSNLLDSTFKDKKKPFFAVVFMLSPLTNPPPSARMGKNLLLIHSEKKAKFETVTVSFNPC
jgi:hypothetical protein